jgi:hypothetical protein
VNWYSTGKGTDKSLHIVSEIETNADNSVTPRPDAENQSTDDEDDDSVRRMSVDEDGQGNPQQQGSDTV